MYAQQSLLDPLFLMLYGGVGFFALVAGFYLWLSRANGFLPEITPPTALRRWTAAFFIMAAMSHVWWYVLGVYWLTDDRLVRDMVAVTLDHVLLVPLVMAILLRLLQDYRHRLWPWFVLQLPILVSAAAGIFFHDEFYGFDLTTYWQLGVMTLFVLYYIYALIRYRRWLRENYADLEHKEVWQSLLFASVLFIVYEAYFTNPGEMYREYLAQLESLAIFVFLLWRVESLQKLDLKEEGIKAGCVNVKEKPVSISAKVPLDVVRLLREFCEEPKLYLQHDLTLTELARALGTNRTYLGQYFAQEGITYNAYINRLRIDYFEQLYSDVVASHRTFTTQELSYQCGFRSYSTFSTAFKQFKGQTVSAWMKQYAAQQ